MAPEEPDAEPDDEFHEIAVAREGEPAPWLTGPATSALSHRFDEALIDPWCIDVVVEGGAIASVTAAPFDGDDRRVIVRTRDDERRPLAPDELSARLAAAGPIVSEPADAAGDDRRAMTVGALAALVAHAALVGHAVDGPPSRHRLRIAWHRVVIPPVDVAAYAALDVASGPSRGPADAAVTIVSFLCLADAAGHSAGSLAALGEVLARYPRDVRLVVKLCPLGRDSQLVAEAVHAAGAQGAFWPMVDAVAAHRGGTLDELVAMAAACGIDATRLRADLEAHRFAGAVERDEAQMAAMAIDSLPSAIIDGVRVHGERNVAVYVAAVEAALARR